MIKFYFNLSPNPMKVALFLEEAGLPYEAIPVDTRAGQQFAPDYVAINPNAKVLTIDDDGATVFDFRHFAPESVPYAHARYQYEAERHYGILDARLGLHRYVVGEAYSIVDMAVWGWARMVPFILGEEAWGKFPNLKRLLDEISARPAAAAVEAFRVKHAPAFKAAMDEEARAHMFKHLKVA